MIQMGLTDFLNKKEEVKKEEKKPEPEGKFNEACALCGGAGTDKKWAGQYWHKRCLRKSKRMAKGMM